MVVEATTLDRLATILASMEQAIQSLSRVVQQQPRKMAPWDENSYFSFATANYFSTASGAVTQILIANPQRVAAIISLSAANDSTRISTDQLISSNSGGMLLGPNTLPFVMRQRDFGPLVTSDWFAFNPTAATNFPTVWEIVLRRWPGG